jgi:4-hydroxybenzoate polyprenyltransferase
MSSVSGTPAQATPGVTARLKGLWENARPGDWWEFKIPPLLATAYATALLLHVSFQELWPLLLLLLFVLLPGAAYVSVLNDITDLEDDLRCGKPNRMVGRTPWFRFGALAFCLVLGIIAGFLLRHDPLTLALYAATWLAYTLYSAPPFRLKVHGIWGVVMDASGAHLFPTLWTASLIAEATGHRVPMLFLCSLGAWASAIGARGILWHQLHDRENDRRGHISTFAADKDPESIGRFVRSILFPLEVAALLLIFLQVNSPWVWVMLIVNLAGEWLTHRYLRIDIILVQSTRRYRIMFGEYYQLQYPLGFLLAMTHQSFEVWWLIALQVVIFPHCSYVFVSNLSHILGYRLPAALARKTKHVLLQARGSKS